MKIDRRKLPEYQECDSCGKDLYPSASETLECICGQPMSVEFLTEVEEVKAFDIARDAFGPYAKHSQEVEDVINMAIVNFNAGNYSMSFELDDDFSDADLEYIENEIQRRLGFQYLTLIFYKKNVIIYM